MGRDAIHWGYGISVVEGGPVDRAVVWRDALPARSVVRIIARCGG